MPTSQMQSSKINFARTLERRQIRQSASFSITRLSTKVMLRRLCEFRAAYMRSADAKVHRQPKKQDAEKAALTGRQDEEQEFPVIGAFGMYWRRDLVKWTGATVHLMGRQSEISQ